MVQEYTDRCYIPCAIRREELKEDKFARALALAAWKEKIRNAWNEVHFVSIDSGPTEGLPVGTSLQVTAEIFLGPLSSDDVLVEVYYGELDPNGAIAVGHTMETGCTKDFGNGTFRFEGSILCHETGQQGFTMRVIPSHPDLAEKHETALITWV
jgi:starch phosphorylase